MEIINFVLLNLANFLNTSLLYRRFFNIKDIIDSFLSFYLLYFCLIIIVITSLGSLNQLYINNIILFELVIFCLLFFMTRKEKKIDKSWTFSIRGIFKNRNFKKIEMFCLSFILGFAIVKIAINLINPTFGWDSLNYHFTFPVEWLKNGNLSNPLVVSDYMAPPYYSINGSIFFFWLILPFRSVFLADIGQLPFFIISFLALFSIARKLGIDRSYSLLLSSLFTITPNYFKQLEIAYVDVMVAAWFFLALNFFLCFVNELNLKNLILSSLSLGVLIGTKNLALLYVGIIFLFFLFVIFKNYHKLQFKKTILFLFSLIIFPLLLGGFTYIRNFILTQNPFYPLNFKIFNFTIFKGVMGISYPSGEVDFSLSKLLFHEGMGAGFIIFVIPGIVIVLIRIIRKRNFKQPIIFLFILFFALYLIYRYIISLPNLRYLYSWIGICYIISFFGINKLKIPITIIYSLVVICFLASFAEIASHTDLVISLILSGLIFFAFSYLLKITLSFIQRPERIIILLVFCLLLIQLLYLDYKENEFMRYKSSQKYSGFWPDAIDSWIWLESNTKGDNIAYVGRPVPFPLYGKNFKNNVYYVSVNKTDPPKLHYFKNSYYVWSEDYLSLHKNLEAEGNYRSQANYSTWLNNILRRKTNYLFVYSLHQTKKIAFPIEDSWARQHPELFGPVFTNEAIHIYKMK